MAVSETKVVKFTFAILAVIVCFAVSAEDDLLDQVLSAPPSSPAGAENPLSKSMEHQKMILRRKSMMQSGLMK